MTDSKPDGVKPQPEAADVVAAEVVDAQVADAEVIDAELVDPGVLDPGVVDPGVVDPGVVDAEVVAAADDGPAKVHGDALAEALTDDGSARDAAAAGDGAAKAGHPPGAELAVLRATLDERTRDLQRITAEYANYRKRVDRDRTLVAEQATGSVLAALLPVLDDLDRARDHGDLTGPFAAVAEQLVNALSKFGLTPFGAKGDAFDPTRHDAVAHSTSADVKEPTCIEVMRRGYLLGERLLRPALVAVADPE